MKPIFDSQIESYYWHKSQQESIHDPHEKIPVILVENFPELGKFVALRFLEWVQNNPEGVVSLPTGKTPEHFIAWTQKLLTEWDNKEIQNLRGLVGLDNSKPHLSGLRFVQIDEFYPMKSTHLNSFKHYVEKYYLEGFGISSERAMLMDTWELGVQKGESLNEIWCDGVDLSLRHRQPKNALERRQQSILEAVDDYCWRYEEKIRDLGGIGFFLGGIGPDGHIAFNIRGSDPRSTTRLTHTNYETQAAAAGDLGGIEVARNRSVITIGLETITYNPHGVALIMAAGEAKAEVVKNAVTSSMTHLIPATSLQRCPRARFVLTRGAAKLLEWRHLTSGSQNIELQLNRIGKKALTLGKPIQDLTQEDFKNSFLSSCQKPAFESLKGQLSERLKRALKRGSQLPSGKKILHTAPHHDDIMLAYLPLLSQWFADRSNQHHFSYLTSGFNAVTNTFMNGLLMSVLELSEAEIQHILGSNPDSDLEVFVQQLPHQPNRAITMRLVRNLAIVLPNEPIQISAQKMISLIENQYPGQKDPPEMQKLKGMVREWEAECVWAHFGFSTEHVSHERLGFYQGDLFTEEPELERDVLPVLARLKKLNPDVVTVALDPEGSGPDTHYKVLQAVSSALKLYLKETGRKDVEVWGYRNVWYRFEPEEASLIAMVQRKDLDLMHQVFMKSFSSQAEASFPSYALDGPFSQLAIQIQMDQARIIHQMLGSEMIGNMKPGCVFIQALDCPTFFEKSRALKDQIE